MPDLSLDLRYLRNVIVAAEQGSFRKAALVLSTSQASVSRRVQLLEHRLGFKLFERDHRGVRLTQAGEDFVREAAAGVNHFDRAVQLAASTHRGERGQLHIGILSSLTSGFLHCVLRRFRESHAGIKVSIHEGTAQENLHRLVLGQLDISFVTGEPMIPGYRTALLWNEQVFVAMPIGHPLARKEEVAWEEIQRETFIVSSGGPGPEIQDYLVQRLANLGFRPGIDVHDVGRESLMNLVGIGYGLTLTSTSTLGLQVSGVVFRPIVGNSDVLPSSAVWSFNNTNPALKRLLALTKSVAKSCTRPPASSASLPTIVMLALNLFLPPSEYVTGTVEMFSRLV